MKLLPIVFVLTVLSAALGACASDESASGAGLLDHQQILDRYDWWDNRDWDWYQDNIPFFDSPDDAINETYYYRWEVVTKHLVYGAPETGYTFTEFIDRPFWSGAYGSISCPAGHQITEVRWLRDHSIVDDFARYWMDAPGAEPRSYTNWYADAVWQTYEVLGDDGWIASMLPYMEAQYQGWVDEHFDSEHGMFRWDGMHDGMETNINSRQTAAPFDGAEGYRPTLNSYVFADMRAISETAAIAGEAEKSAAFAQRAADLRSRAIEELWDERRQFFLPQFANDEKNGIRALSRTYESGPYAGNDHGRELIGYVPWQFNLPDSAQSVAWKFLMDPDYFNAPFGPTVTERRDPLFLISPTCCVWSGNSWPFATSQTLVAFANLLNNYEQDFVDQSDYFDLLTTYTRTHQKNGRPYIAEALHPDTGSWDGHDMTGHSEHYFHSGYVDLIISGLVGLRPSAGDTLVLNPLVPKVWDYFALDNVAYHGVNLDIVWDRTGSHYGRGQGLQIFADGKRIARSSQLNRISVVIPKPPTSITRRRRFNVAVNNGRAWPVASASYSEPATPPHFAVDGARWYHVTPANRWTTRGSTSESDWFAIDFGTTQTVDEAILYFLDDSTGVATPASFDLEYKRGAAWLPLPDQRRDPIRPEGHRGNHVRFPAVAAEGIRAAFTHAPGSRTGLTEFEVWTPVDGSFNTATDPSPDLAFRGNPDHPTVNASFLNNPDELHYLTDGLIGMTTYQGERWSAAGSPNRSDHVQFDWNSNQTIGQVDVFVWADPPGYHPRPKRPTPPPKSITIQYASESGEWLDVTGTAQTPTTPRSMSRSHIEFDSVSTSSLRVVFEHDGAGRSAATEIQVWR